jgi:predicted metal-binding protein
MSGNNGASVLLCNGCCCGHLEKGNPALPKARLLADWAAGAWEDAVRLRFVDCLGPCEHANMAVVKLADGAVWLADLTTADYDALAGWASEVAGVAASSETPAGATPPPLPESLAARRIPPRGTV